MKGSNKRGPRWTPTVANRLLMALREHGAMEMVTACGFIPPENRNKGNAAVYTEMARMVRKGYVEETRAYRLTGAGDKFAEALLTIWKETRGGRLPADPEGEAPTVKRKRRRRRKQALNGAAETKAEA